MRGISKAALFNFDSLLDLKKTQNDSAGQQFNFYILGIFR